MEEPARTQIEKDRGIAIIIYILYILSFLTGVTALIGVILAYIKRPEARGSWVESHFNFQIKTFWIMLFLVAIGIALKLIFIGVVILFIAGIWYIYRIAKGLLAINDNKAVALPE